MTSLTPKMQQAAVVSALSDGKSLEDVEKDYPELSAGIRLERDAQEQKRRSERRGSGSDQPLPALRISFP